MTKISILLRLISCLLLFTSVAFAMNEDEAAEKRDQALRAAADYKAKADTKNRETFELQTKVAAVRRQLDAAVAQRNAAMAQYRHHFDLAMKINEGRLAEAKRILNYFNESKNKVLDQLKRTAELKFGISSVLRIHQELTAQSATGITPTSNPNVVASMQEQLTKVQITNLEEAQLDQLARNLGFIAARARIRVSLLEAQNAQLQRHLQAIESAKQVMSAK